MEQTWQNCKEKLKASVGAISYDTWIAPLTFKASEGNSFTIAAPDTFFKTWIEANYLPQIKQTLAELTGKNWEILFAVNPGIFKTKVNRGFKTIGESFREEPQDSFRLNPRFSFGNFIIGASNRMAHAASLAVAEAPGKSYNPLFIYGGTGLGKTHLMQSIAQFILIKNPSAKIKYTSSERFTNELIYSIQTRATEKFRQKYRGVDALLIDDIQFLAGKEASQEEFFHTFNVLYDAHKQIVISSDRPPKEIAKLEERLVSRFGWGLVVDVQPPDFETRVAILKKKIENDPVRIDEEVLHFIAKNISTNIRELEGALVRIMAYSLIENKPIALALVKDILKDMVKEVHKRITPELVLEAVSSYFNTPKDELRKNKRSKNMVLPRQTAMYLIRSLTELSFPEIGSFFGSKHHTTILYAYKKMVESLKKDEKLRFIVDRITQDIKDL